MRERARRAEARRSRDERNRTRGAALAASATQAASENEERRDGVKAKIAAGAAFSRSGYRFCRRRADGRRRGTHALASGSSAIRTAAITPTTRLATSRPRRLRSLLHASRQSSCELRRLRASANGQPVVSASVVERRTRSAKIVDASVHLIGHYRNTGAGHIPTKAITAKYSLALDLGEFAQMSH